MDWFVERYEDLVLDDHEQDHSRSDPDYCRRCSGTKEKEPVDKASQDNKKARKK